MNFSIMMAIIVGHGFFCLGWETPCYLLKVFPIKPIKKLTHSMNGVPCFDILRWNWIGTIMSFIAVWCKNWNLLLGILHILKGIVHLLFVACLLLIAGAGRRILMVLPLPTQSHRIKNQKLIESSRKKTFIRCTLKGSLAYTGKGHSTDHAVALGLHGYLPASLTDKDCNR